MPATPFSALIRAATQAQHTEAEESAFMTDMLGGRLGLQAYTRYTEQLWFIYRALEDAADLLAEDPVAGPFMRPELMRVTELERDLAYLGGPGWRADGMALAATAAYSARITELARTWPAGYIAHHYTRYLGDLSGGQVIRGVAERTWGFARKGDGVRFYVFGSIANPAAFKREYRELLDALPVSEVEKQRVVEECRRAFAFNTALFRALGAQFPLSA